MANVLTTLLQRMGLFRKPVAASDDGLWSDIDTVVRRSSAGVTVSAESALSAGAVFACVRNLAEDLAKLPLILYKRLEDGKKRETEDPLYYILHDSPNPESTSFNMRLAVTGMALLRGNGYCEIQRDGYGRCVGLWQMDSKRVQAKRSATDRLYYELTNKDGSKRNIIAEDVLHIPGFSTDGITGLMLATLGRETIGLAQAVEQFAGTFFGNGALAGNILVHPSKLSDNARRNLKTSFDEQARGPAAHGTVVLEEGIKVEKTSVDPEASQFIQTRQFSVEDVARWFRMPPHKIGHLLRAAGWSTLEATNADYVIDTLMPWAVRWEQEISRKLLPKQGDLFAEHLFDALLRGDTLARSQSNQIRWMNGTLSADEWRAMDNLNPLPGGMGKTYFVPANMVPLEKALKEPETETSSEPMPDMPDDADDMDQVDQPTDAAEQSAKARRAGMRLFADGLSRLLRKELNAVGRAEVKYTDKQRLSEELAQFYDKFVDEVYEVLIVPAMAFADLVSQGGLTTDIEEATHTAVNVYATKHARTSLAQCSQLSPTERRMTWTSERAPEAARKLVDDITAAVTLAAGVVA